VAAPAIPPSISWAVDFVASSLQDASVNAANIKGLTLCLHRMNTTIGASRGPRNRESRYIPAQARYGTDDRNDHFRPSDPSQGVSDFLPRCGGFAVISLPAWLLSLHGFLPALGWNALAWHRHEMLFGFTTAVIAGFLLTAVSNWTSRETLTGLPLLALFALWALGRVLMLLSGSIAPLVVALVDASFLPALALVIARPLAASKNRRNYGIVFILGALAAANVGTHLEVAGVSAGLGRTASLFATDIVTLLMLLIAGRIIPAFTRNATGAAVRSIPLLDRAALAATAAFTVASALRPESPVSALFAFIAALFAATRTVHWGLRAALRDPMLWILHAGHWCIVIGLALRGLSVFVPTLVPSLGVHAVTVGGIGLLTLAMMTRVALGHTGRPIRAPRSIVWAFAAMSLAVPMRAIMPAIMPSEALWFWSAAGVLFASAFGIYLGAIGPMLVRPRVDGKPG
jgi:uncharacterized protein involved in response to NO